MINNLDIQALKKYTAVITENPEEAISSYGITAVWKGGTKTEIRTHNQKVGSKEIVKNFNFMIDEPQELLGSNEYPTPQDYLLGGMAGCMMVGFVILASDRGISLDSVELTITGALNLRGMLELDETVPVGFGELQFNFNVKGSGADSDYKEIIEHVQKISPNYRTIIDHVKVVMNDDAI